MITLIKLLIIVSFIVILLVILIFILIVLLILIVILLIVEIVLVIHENHPAFTNIICKGGVIILFAIIQIILLHFCCKFLKYFRVFHREFRQFFAQ